MTRKEKILAYVQAKNKAVTTKEIADDLGILRNNVSKELNVLVLSLIHISEPTRRF